MKKLVDAEILDFISDLKEVSISLSLGKDSIVCLDIAKKCGVKINPFYFFHTPDLDFIENQVKMYEDFFKIKIIQMPHPMLYDRIRHHDYCSRNRANWLAEFDFPKMDFDEMRKWYLTENGINSEYNIVGRRASESFRRNMYFRKNPPIDHEKKLIHPIWNWKESDCFEYIQQNKIPIIRDYKIWGRSWDGLNFQWIIEIKNRFPGDYEKIKELFPLIELEVKRYEFNKKYMG